MRIIDWRDGKVEPIARPDPGPEPLEAVRSIIAKVRAEGDDALRAYTEEFDGVRLDSLRVPSNEIDAAWDSSDEPLKSALREAASRIEQFAQRQALKDWEAEIGGGKVGEAVHPVERAGLYVPGGRATYPSSVLMTAVPARVAGVQEIVLCVPPAIDGSIPKATLAAAKYAGLTEAYRVGGAQAIAAMAFGTESVRRVSVIAGPGNIFVALAKREVAGFVGIDSIAGPSEIAIVASGDADPDLVAWDLIAQAEHGPHGSFLLVTWDESLPSRVESALARLLNNANSQIKSILEQGASTVLVSDVEEAAAVINEFAPEHLELIFDGAENEIARFRAAGAIFVGPFSPVSLGDYLAGSNHVLPTAGTARWSSGLRTSHFQKTTAVVRHTRESLRAALPHIQELSRHEGLPNHAKAVEARFRE